MKDLKAVLPLIYSTRSLILSVLVMFSQVTFAQNQEDNRECIRLSQDKEYVVAFAPCSIAAEQGRAEAQYFLGTMYSLGNGIPRNSEMAIFWLTKSADQDIPIAQFSLAKIYRTGDGTPKNFDVARALLTKAVPSMDEASYILGEMHRNGEGTTASNVIAYAWYSVSATRGNNEAIREREDLEARLTVSELREAQSLSQEYFNEHIQPMVRSEKIFLCMDQGINLEDCRL